MKELTPEILREAKGLIDQFRSGRLTDEDLSAITETLDRLLPDPHWYDYTIDHIPELSSEEVVRRAFSYKPIQL